MAYPVAPKTSAAGLSAAVSGAVLYLLQTYAFKGTVPDGIASLIYVAVPGVLAFAAAYMAPHQSRPLRPGYDSRAGFDDGPPPADPSNVTLRPPADLT